MIDSDLATLALRNRMLQLGSSVFAATTGSTTLSATATGYARATGSFLADGFRDGMEFLAGGFATSATNGYRVIESVGALSIVTSTAIAQPTAESAASGRTLSVGLPQGRALDNKTFTPSTGRPFIEEDYVPAAHALIGYPSQGSRNAETGIYAIRWYGLEGKGEAGIRRPVDALRRLFAPGTVLTLSDGTVVRMTRDAAVYAGQILPQGTGWAVCTVTVPWVADSNNLITA